MIIILAAAMIATNFFLVGRSTSQVVEGMVSKSKNKASNKEKLSGINKKDFTKNSKHVSQDKERVDYATTVEQAYDNLENIVGKGGISKLTQDTSRLMDKQNKMFENLQSMGPLINQYKEMMGSMNLENINKLTTTLVGK
jgi:hypothetical protein